MTVTVSTNADLCDAVVGECPRSLESAFVNMYPMTRSRCRPRMLRPCCGRRTIGARPPSTTLSLRAPLITRALCCLRSAPAYG